MSSEPRVFGTGTKLLFHQTDIYVDFLSIVFYFFQLLGFGSSLLDGIDPNPENFVMAGIVHTREAQIGCLLRLEPNKQAQVKQDRDIAVLAGAEFFIASQRLGQN